IWPRDRSKDFIKRVVAVAGETIEIRDHQIFIDGKPRDDPHASWVVQRPFGRGEHYGPFKGPPGYVFVMGDNRDQSYDSRFWGPVRTSDIKGEAFIIYWSGEGPDRWVRWDRIGRLVYCPPGRCGTVPARLLGAREDVPAVRRPVATESGNGAGDVVPT